VKAAAEVPLFVMLRPVAECLRASNIGVTSGLRAPESTDHRSTVLVSYGLGVKCVRMHEPALVSVTLLADGLPLM
jgi:hypothetical protein